MKGDASLLLLDLDGVVVYEAMPPESREREILLLHDNLRETLRDLGCPIVVLTHRSRREARRILAAAGVLGPDGPVQDIMAAEDLLLAAMRTGGPMQLLRRGLCKSWILPVVEARHGVPRGRMAFIDDRVDNLDALGRHGVGLRLHAPSGFVADGPRMVSFDVADAVAAIRHWQSAGDGPACVALTRRCYDVAPWRRTGLHTRKESLHAFNAARMVMRHLRQAFARRRGDPA
ncbi:hypothetical protein CKO45_07675 [Paracraurococcus ruber]|uniref:Uncharacterized protein n=2 Tax=Paracraurococcus ruber TaxID=77675 RepID=A0ABS1CUD4_9PROT|nr:hypothetical protein [Paracraurococcus ruber]